MRDTTRVFKLTPRNFFTYIGLIGFRAGTVSFAPDGCSILQLITKGSPEDLLLEIGMVLKGAGVSKEEALRALQAAQKAVHG